MTCSTACFNKVICGVEQRGDVLRVHVSKLEPQVLDFCRQLQVLCKSPLSRDHETVQSLEIIGWQNVLAFRAARRDKGNLIVAALMVFDMFE